MGVLSAYAHEPPMIVENDANSQKTKEKKCLTTSTKTKRWIEAPKCSICERTLFKVERVSPDIVRLTCENCGESYLIVINSETDNQFVLKFIGPEENKLATF